MPRPKKSDANEIVLPLFEQDPFPFGRWAGVPMCEVPASYLVGAYDDGVFDPKKHKRVVQYIRKRLKALQAEARLEAAGAGHNSEDTTG